MVIRKRALNAILSTAIYVEGLNTPGSGDRWADGLKKAITSLARSKAEFAICRNQSLAKHKLRCYSYKDWIIAFRLSENTFEECRFIHDSRLH